MNVELRVRKSLEFKTLSLATSHYSLELKTTKLKIIASGTFLRLPKLKT